MNWKKTYAIGQAILLTASLGFALRFGDSEVQGLIEKLKGLWNQILDDSQWWAVGALLLLGVLLPFFIAWVRSVWYWILSKSFAPLVFLAVLSFTVFAHHHWPDSWLWHAATLLATAASLSFCLWPAESSDHEEKDLLYREYFVKRLSEIFQSSTTTLRRVAIMGSWGAGKTMLLRMLRKKLRDTDHGDYRIAFVNPWKAKTPEEAWAILAKGFDDALGFPSPLGRLWSRYPILKGLWKLIPLPGIADDVLAVFEGSGNISDKQRLEKINRLLTGRKLKILLLVDDMERAEPAVIRKMFPVIDHLCEMKCCYFVFAIDRERVAKAFGKDGADEAKGYLDKVFDIQLELPVPRVGDIGRMCEASLDKEECPRLHRAFGELKPLLPRNPRAARRFMNLAKTKETLFLNRYGEEEHPYVPFFLLWMLESEFPGSIEIIQHSKFEKHREKLFRYEILSGEKRHDLTEFEEMLKALCEKVTEDDSHRIEEIFNTLVEQIGQSLARPWLGLSGFDFQWAANDHMQLLQLSAEERAKLGEQWLQHAGSKSVEEMLRTAMPEKEFSNVDVCAKQFVELETSRITNLVRECYGLSDEQEVETKLRSALSAVRRLRDHLEFAKRDSLAVDLDAFDEALFRKWLEEVSRTSMGEFEGANAKALMTERHEFSYDMIPLISVSECYGLYIGGVSRIVDRPNNSEAKETTKYVAELRERLIRRISDYVFDLFREGKIPEGWFENSVTNRGGLEFLYDPRNWLPFEFSDGLGALEKLVEEAESSANVANGFAGLVDELYLEPLSKGFDTDRFDERRAIRFQIDNGQDDFIRFLWKGAISPQTDAKQRDRLFQLREKAIDHGDGQYEPPANRPERKYFIWDSEVEAIFSIEEKLSEKGETP